MPALPGLPATAAFLSFLHALPSTHRQQQQSQNELPDEPNQTVLYLALGGLIGVLYSLGTEKFLRAMQHRHIFVRNAMLWLAAITWLFAAAAVAVVASLIYHQAEAGLEGFDRVLGVLLPFVVRADLVVDWAKRVAWALLNMSNWTQAAVQTRRLLARAPAMKEILQVDDDVISMVRRGDTREHDLVESEDQVWKEGTDSLVRVADVLQHFEKLGRIAVYATGGLLAAVPVGVVWIFYAAYHGAVSMHEGQHSLGILYWISVFLAPFGAIIMLLASAGLLCGVVTLSVVGTIIQFAVYWSTRTVYSMVRIVLSQGWAGFPDITKPHSMRNIEQAPRGPNATNYAVRAVRQPEEAGAAIAQMGALLPTELEFALASWDGFHKGDKVNPEWLTTRIFKNLHLSFFDDEESTLNGEVRPRKGRALVVKRVPDGPEIMGAQRGQHGVSPGAPEMGVPEAEEPSSRSTLRNHIDSRRTGVKHNETALILLGRLGLDLSVRSTRRRRLSTYYAFAMLVSLQIESGGNACRFQTILDLSDEEFQDRMKAFKSSVADEAQIALQELLHRLTGSTKYRLVPRGAPSSTMVPVTAWVRTAMLTFLETPSESDGTKQRPSDLISVSATSPE